MDALNAAALGLSNEDIRGVSGINEVSRRKRIDVGKETYREIGDPENYTVLSGTSTKFMPPRRSKALPTRPSVKPPLTSVPSWPSLLKK